MACFLVSTAEALVVTAAVLVSMLALPVMRVVGDAMSPGFGSGDIVVALRYTAFERGEGTIRFNGRWELIDLFFAPRSINAKAEILRIPFLMEWDNVHAGYKPRRTYSGPRWCGGVSDHCPVALLRPL